MTNSILDFPHIVDRVATVILDLDSGNNNNNKKTFLLSIIQCCRSLAQILSDSEHFLRTNPKRTNLATVVREGHAKEEWA